MRSWLLCVTILPFLVNCSSEESLTLERNADEVKARLITFEELQGMPKAMEKLNSLTVRKNKRLAYSSKYDFTVDTDKILLVEKGAYQSLSFPVYWDKENGYVENLFLHPHKNGYLAFLMRYNLTPTDIINLDDGKIVDNLTSKMQYTPLTDFDITDLGVDYTNAIETNGYTGTIILYEGQCWRINHVWGDDEGKVWYNIVLCPGCECGQNGSGSGGSGSNSGGGISYAQYYAIVDLSSGGGGSGGGSSGGGSGGGGGGHDPSDGFTNPFNPIKFEDVEPQELLMPGLFNPHPIVGVVSPNKPDPHKKNCEELKKMMEDQNLNNAINALKTKTNDPRDEFGYSLSEGALPNPLEKTQTSRGAGVKMRSGGTIFGIIHTHPDHSGPDQHTPMFSTPDIIALYVLAKNYSNPDIPAETVKEYSKFVLTLTVKGGSSGTSTYALKIENWTEFSKFVDDYKAMSSEARRVFNLNLAVIYSRQPSNYSPTDYLRVLFKYMNDKGIKGLAIYKANDDLTEWEKQVYNPNSNIITSQPCP